MSIILVKLPQQPWSYGTSLAAARHCRLEPSSPQHAAYVDEEGVLNYQHIDVSARSVSTLFRFQLQLQAAEGAPYEPISKPWLFEFVAGMPGELLLVQAGSCRILYASLPKQGSEASDVFLFGSHTAPVSCISTNGNIVLSGCSRGSLKLWRLSDGQLADACSQPDNAAVTAIECLGPLLLAVGSSSGSITLYDLASGRLLAVQRLLAGPGSVCCMATFMPHDLLAAANLAGCGPRQPDGGGVLPGPGVGAGFREAEGFDSPPIAAAAAPGTHALLAVASTSGWLCVFGAALPGCRSWSLIHSTGSLCAAAAAALAFSPDGSTLAVASPAAQLLGTYAVAAAAADIQPGAVSLYQVASGGSSSSRDELSGLLPPLLLEQQQRQQLQELKVWRQWSLSSVPVGLAVLPSSGLSLVSGQQLQPKQVLQLLVMPQVGPGLVLCADRQLPLPSTRNSSLFQQQPQQQEDVELQTAAAVGAPDEGNGAPERVGTQQQQQHQHQQQKDANGAGAAAGAAVGSRSSSSSMALQQQSEDEDFLLNIAERDLADVADAIAAAAAPLHDAELSALLAEVTAGMVTPAGAAQAAAAAARASGQPAEPPSEPPAFAAAGDGSGDWAGAGSISGGGMAAQPRSSHVRTARGQEDPGNSSARAAAAAGDNDTVDTWMLQAGCAVSGSSKQQQTEHGDHNCMSEPGPTAVAAEADAATAELAAMTTLRVPRTLPNLRSWMDPSAAVAGLAAPIRTTPVDLEALAAEESQQQLQQLQQQLQQEEVPCSQQKPQQQQQHAEPGLHKSGDQAAAAAGVGVVDQHHPDGEQELPCDSSFQHLLQPVCLQQQGQQQHAQHPGLPHDLTQPPELQHQGHQTDTEQQHNHAQHKQQQGHWPDDQLGQLQPRPLPLPPSPMPQTVQEPTESMLCRTASNSSAGAPVGTAAVAAVGYDKQAAPIEPEPQPRQLPAMLRQQRPSTMRLPAAAGAVGGRSAAVAPAQMHRTTPDGPSLTKPSAASSSSAASSQLHQQQQQQQQGVAEVPPAVQHQQHTPTAGELSVRQRLSVRQQQQKQKHLEAEAKSAAAGVIAARQGNGTAAGGESAGLKVQMNNGQRVPASDHPLATAVQNSSRLLAQRIKEVEQAPDVSIDPSGPAALKLAAACISDLDLATDQQQYQYEELPDLQDVATPTHAQKLVPKQLDAHWVASRSLKPSMETLFKPEEWQQSFVDPQVLVLPHWPTPQQVVQQLLWPGQPTSG